MEESRTVPEIIDYLIINSMEIKNLVIAFETNNGNFYTNGNRDDMIINLGMLEYAKEALLRGNDADDAQTVDEQVE